jgi:hypothetical protein
MRPGLGVLAIGGLLSLSCNHGPLTGSVSELFPLDVQKEQIRVNTNAFEVTYLASDGLNEDIVVQLTVALQGANFKAGQDIPLAGEYAPGQQRATVSHLSAGQAEVVFPAVSDGDLKLSSGGNPGEQTSGNFSLSFVNSPNTGGGRTLQGNFSGLAVDAGYGPGI